MSARKRHIQEVRNDANTLIEHIPYQLRDKMVEIERIDLLVETMELIEKYHRENDVVVRYGYEERTAEQLRVRLASLLNLGLTVFEDDNPERALKYYKEAEEHAESLVAMAIEDVDRFSYGGDLDMVYSSIAMISEKIGDNKQAESYYEKRVDFWEETVEKDDSILSAMKHHRSIKDLDSFLQKEADESEED